MEFSVKNKNENAVVTVSERAGGEGIIIADVDMTFDVPTVPSAVTVRWQYPCDGIWTIFSSVNQYTRNNAPSWRKRKTETRLAYGAPLHEFISQDSLNCLAISVSDAATPIEICSGVVERSGMIECDVNFFTAQINAISSYRASIYLDTRRIRYEKVIKDIEKYWAESCGYPSAYTPAAARAAVYSTWYSYHKDFTEDQLLGECRLAKPMGMDTIILDDGWQCSGSQGYECCGDWEPSELKIKDMRAFSDRVHETGMNLVVWFHLPALGHSCSHMSEFGDMTLNPSSDKWSALDPRYPQVREYLTGTLCKAAKDWKLDGLKLDFIDSFKYYAETKNEDPRFDTLSIDDGVDKLLYSITTELRRYKPDFLIEFRQYYFGPVIRKYGNMIRVGDCPHDSLRNHVAGTDLRLMLGKTAVHSDMLMWNAYESVEDAAAQLISTLFLVPQISVRLAEIPENHIKMLRFYLNFRNTHINTLMDGDLTAENPESCYSLVKSVLDGETVAVSYADPVLKLTDGNKIYHINSNPGSMLYEDCENDLGSYSYVIYNACGDITEQGYTELNAGVHRFNVPVSGMLELTKR